MRYLFIINSICNPVELHKLENAIAALEDNKRALIELKYTQYQGHAMEIAAEASDQFDDKITIVACGGDGTVHEIVNGIAYRQTPLIIIPIGKGNDFAHSILPKHIFKNPTKIIEMLDEAKVVPMDLVRIDSYDVLGNHLPMWSRFCVNVASMGIDTKALIAADDMAKKKNKYGISKATYAKYVIKALKDKAYRLDYNLEVVDSDANELSENEEFLSITICNGKYYGGGFCPSPNALIDDGVLNICAVEKMGFWDSIRTMFFYRNGTHVGRPGVRTFKATSGIITCKDNSFQLLGNSDGTIFHGHRIRFEVFPESLNIGIFSSDKSDKSILLR